MLFFLLFKLPLIILHFFSYFVIHAKINNDFYELLYFFIALF